VIAVPFFCETTEELINTRVGKYKCCSTIYGWYYTRNQTKYMDDTIRETKFASQIKLS